MKQTYMYMHMNTHELLHKVKKWHTSKGVREKPLSYLRQGSRSTDTQLLQRIHVLYIILCALCPTKWICTCTHKCTSRHTEEHTHSFGDEGGESGHVRNLDAVEVALDLWNSTASCHRLCVCVCVCVCVSEYHNQLDCH